MLCPGNPTWPWRGIALCSLPLTIWTLSFLHQSFLTWIFILDFGDRSPLSRRLSMFFPMTVKINPGFDVNLGSFHDAEQKFRDILKILEENKLNKILSARSKLFKTELTELHKSADLPEEGIIRGIIGGTEVTISAALIADVFEFDKDVEEDVLTNEDLGMALTVMHFTGLNPSNLKKIEVADEFKFLADIIGKVIFCKASSHDVITKEQLRVMSYVVLKKKIDWGKLIFKLLQTKLVLPIIPYGRILSVILSTSYPSSCLSKGLPIPPGKSLSSSLFSKWKRKIFLISLFLMEKKNFKNQTYHHQ